MKIYLSIIFLIMINFSYGQDVDYFSSFDSTKIAYSSSGNGKFTLIFVHGWCCNKNFWKYQTPYFNHFYKTVIIDLAGHGDSETRDKLSFDNWGRDIVSLVNFLNLRQYILIGHSSGGYVVLNAATKADNRLLAIVGVDSYRGPIIKNYSDEFFNKAEQNIRDTGENFKESMQDIDRWFVAESDSSNISWIKSEMAECKMETAAQGVREYYITRNETENQFKKISCPAFGINSSSNKFDLDYFENTMIDFRPFYMDNVGHFIMMDNPKLFNHLLETIIKSIEKN